MAINLPSSKPQKCCWVGSFRRITRPWLARGAFALIRRIMKEKKWSGWTGAFDVVCRRISAPDLHDQKKAAAL
jgi:hypothetical protein